MICTHRFKLQLALIILAAVVVTGCTTAFKAKPLPFRLPETYPNATEVVGTTVGAEAYVERSKAQDLFGFDIRGAGMLPVQVVFDHQGETPLSINPAQTFLEDDKGNLWPILEERFAYDRVTKYVQTKEIFKEGAYQGFLGGVAGTLVGAAVGVVTGENVATSAGKGAAVGAAAGAVMGGTKGAANTNMARRKVMEDFREKSLQNKAIEPGNLAYGFLFFPGEAKSATHLRLQLVEEGTDTIHTLDLAL